MTRRNAKSVLVIEDDPHSRLALRTVLEAQGYRVFEVSNADEAIRYLYSNIRPDLIILDLRLPGTGGAQLNAELKGNTLFREIPVIVTSAYLDEPFDRTVYAAVFEKPVDTTKLLGKIAEIFGRY